MLRDCDKISTSDFKEAVSIINSTNPGLIFIDGAGDKNSISSLVKFIKSKNISQILVTSAVDYDFIMTLYDEGLDDYISENYGELHNHTKNKKTDLLRFHYITS